MPGTYASDSLASNLLTGATLGSAATSNGTAVQVDWPGLVNAKLVTGTVTGTSPTLDVAIQGCESSGFASNVQTLGRFKSTGDEDGVTHELVVDVRTKYVRAAIVTGGTTPVYTGSTLTLQPLRYQWTKLDSAGALL